MNKKVGITLRGVTLDNIAPNIDENMMEELLNNRELYLDFMRGFNPNIETVVNLIRERDALKYLLQEYKDLEKHGLLLRLPVALGTICYRIIFNGIHSKEKWRIEEQAFKTEDIVWIGSHVFLTREEAERKLKEMGE